jgi:hypothetical protein
MLCLEKTKEAEMAQERLTMRKISEVLRLKWECNLSNRAIARSCSISHSTVAEYLRRAQEAGLSCPLPEDMGEDTLFELLFPQAPPSSSRVIPYPDWSLIHTELRKKSVTLRLLWVEYREAHSDGYGYSQFCALYREWAKCLKPSMRLTHKAGEKVFVDYAGQTVPIVEPDTGEIHDAQIFIGVLGASNYTYAEAHESQELFNWIGAHVRMFAFFGAYMRNRQVSDMRRLRLDGNRYLGYTSTTQRKRGKSAAPAMVFPRFSLVGLHGAQAGNGHHPLAFPSTPGDGSDPLPKTAVA